MNQILGRLKTKADGVLFDLKEKAKSEGKKQVNKYKDKLPNEDQIAEKLGKFQQGLCEPNKKKRLEAKYNKLKNFLKKAQTIIGGSVAALTALLGLLKKYFVLLI